MKKFAILERSGRWEILPDGRKVIHCTIEDIRFIEDGNDYLKLSQKYEPLYRSTEHPDGTWTLLTIESRVSAKRDLEWAEKKRGEKQ